MYNFYSQKKYDLVRIRTKQAIFISGLIGLITVILVTIFRKFLLCLIYNTNLGANYILALSPFFTFYYLEAPILSAMHVLKKSKNATIISVISCIIRLITLLIFTKKLKIYSN